MTTSETDIDTVLDTVRERVDPLPDEQDALANATAELIERVNAEAADRDIDLVAVTQTGSTARGTFVSGDRDIDLFVQFPSETDEAMLEQSGLALGEAILPESKRDFAAHPYTKGEFRGFEVDVVPCFAVDTASEIQSAVDRTPFHTQFLEDRLTKELAGDVRIAKQFLKGIGAYGSDVATGGFSGFLTELLVLEHGGFMPLLNAAANEWDLPVGVFNPGNHTTDTLSEANNLDVMVDDDLHIQFDDPLVVIDPTDPGRNVSAALSVEKLGTFMLNARKFLDNPSIEFFESSTANMPPSDIVADFDERDTVPVALEFNRPDDIVDDTFVPQLQKSLRGITDALDRHGFDVFRATVFANDDVGTLFMELAVAERPAVERHEGPPVDTSYAFDFIAAYENEDGVSGPFIVGNRVVIERHREFTSARDFLEREDILDVVSVGPVIEAAMCAGNMEVVDDVGRLAEQFPLQMTEYVNPNVIGGQ